MKKSTFAICNLGTERSVALRCTELAEVSLPKYLSVHFAFLKRFTFCVFLFYLLPCGKAAAQWQQLIFPAESDVINCFAVSGSSIYAGTRINGVYLSNDNGNSWNTISTGLTNLNVKALVVNGSVILAGTDGGSVFRSVNNGASWAASNSGLSYTYIWALAASGTTVYAGAYGGGVFKSVNDGASWTGINSGLTINDVRTLAVSDTIILAGTDAGGIYRTLNNGASWTTANSGLPGGAYTFWTLVAGNSLVFAGSSGYGMFKSANNGASWTTANNGLTDMNVISLAITSPDSSGSGTAVFAGTDGGGVFLTTNSGSNWMPVNNGLTDTYISALAADKTYIYAGTGSSGVWRRPISELTGINISHTERSRSTTLNIYPNPASNIIEIEISDVEPVETPDTPNTSTLSMFIEILNSQGQLIETVTKTASKTTIDITKYPCGIYWVRAKNNNSTMVKKFIRT